MLYPAKWKKITVDQSKVLNNRLFRSFWATRYRLAIEDRSDRSSKSHFAPFWKYFSETELIIKGEIHSKIESILKERVHFFLQNSEKMMKIGWEIRKIWHFEISHFFGKHFLTSPHEYSNERVDDVIPSQFFIYIVYEKNFNFHF